jgi:hypothetical protein
MMRRAVILVVLAVAIPVDAGERLTMRLWPSVAVEPAVLTIRTVIEAAAENRALQIVAQSADYYRSSVIQLDGDKAPRLSVVEFKNLPTGIYDVTSVLLGADGQRTAVGSIFRVAPSAGSGR